MKIAMIGTRGVPAQYGGFETAVEEIGSRLAESGHEVIVYCRNSNQSITSYKGMTLVNLPALRFKATETLSHALVSTVHATASRPDVAIVFNPANAPCLPLLKALRIPVVTHLDGVEYNRAKWGEGARRYLRLAYRLSVQWSDVVIADAEAIAAFVRRRLGADPAFIPYGAPEIAADPRSVVPSQLEPAAYHLVVARLEPENNVHVIVDAYARAQCEWPLVIVGSAPYESSYHGLLRQQMAATPNIREIGSVWDQGLLDQLYANAGTYVHGHSVGGTNPSLLRAMGAGACVLAFDNVFAREVAQEGAAYFEDSAGLSCLLEEMEGNAEARNRLSAAARTRVRERYQWAAVARDYERLCISVARGNR